MSTLVLKTLAFKMVFGAIGNLIIYEDIFFTLQHRILRNSFQPALVLHFVSLYRCGVPTRYANEVSILLLLKF